MRPTLSSDDLRACIAATLGALDAARLEIDAANVFPVADRDTGTNLVLTFQAAADAARGPDPFAAVPTAALAGARGNSGVICAQFLLGLLTAGADGDADADAIRLALGDASRLAYEAVLEPVEGTMLSVIRAAAIHATGDTPVEVFSSAARAARFALEQTPTQMVALADEGVWDAGAMGMWVVFDAFAATLEGRQPSPLNARSTSAAVPISDHFSGGSSGLGSDAGPAPDAYEVQVLLEADASAVDPLRVHLAALGTSVVVSGDGRRWNIHMHVADTGAAEVAVQACRSAGSVRESSINTVMQRTIAGGRVVPIAAALRPVAVVAVASGVGFADLYRELGAAAVVEGGPQMMPRTGDIVAAIATASTPDVIVLPNSAEALEVATQASRQASGRQVVVIPTRDMAHGITTMLAYGDARDLAHNVAQMRQAADAASTASVVVLDDGSACAVVDGEPLPAHPDPVAALVDAALALDTDAPCEVMTVFAGEAVSPQERAQIYERLVEAFPGVDVEVRDGGQVAQRYLLAVE